jgi:hypothetical protein
MMETRSTGACGVTNSDSDFVSCFKFRIVTLIYMSLLSPDRCSEQRRKTYQLIVYGGLL